ncbi:helix-turn-helix domain-containing protein [Cryobacterium tagatosivorans]|uniref:XRE family transcriptional regulator n=1 Tax=Cryobacterium tagatosivorans TaxID=1259199 RepID=A0A4V3I683_9MICO|nr:helix-turn-helix transcriptional regulator [Cryobacterium tagatosivorans]TFB47264.1 XRE family transcriptional regulator [Cryobacterium tagatosivorans]
MTDPRFRPRAYTHEPGAFGKAAIIEWILPASAFVQDRVQAAWLQHIYAARITRMLRKKKMTLTAYADTAGVGYDRMSKVLRGEAVMRLEDLAQSERILGGILGPLPESPVRAWDGDDY